MNTLNSAEYYQSRERQERELAQSAKDASIRSIHLEMAARYSELIFETSPALRIVD